MKRPLLTDPEPVERVTWDTAAAKPAGAIVATDDDELIREWAQRHNAQPATGEATTSGPATVDIKDGGAGVRFNFPGTSRFREITWDEWLANFHEYQLLFVYEREDPSGTYRLVPKSRLAEPA